MTSRTVRANVTIPEVGRWAEAHGLVASDYTSEVSVNADGSVILQKYRRAESGDFLLNDARTEILTVAVGVPATPPFPL